MDGYGERAKETWAGAGYGAADALTLGLALDEEDRAAYARTVGVDPNSGYFAAGQVVGGVTVGAATIAATGGLAGSTQAGTLWNVARTAAHGYRATAFASDGAHIVRAGAEFAQTGDWTARQSMALLSAGAHGGGCAIRGLAKAPKPFWGSWDDYSKVNLAGREYAKVGRRLYTEHAVDRMLPRSRGGRGIAPVFVEDVIATGTKTTQRVNGVTRTVHTSGTVQVVTEQGGRIVVTVNPFSGG